MNHQGHGVALDHAIFNTPNAVSFPVSETKERGPSQEGHTSPLYPDGMPATYGVVDFEVDQPDGWNPTLVSHEGFFTDVPGFESLVEGQSSKMLGSLALARQGSYFYWGYSIDPQRLTDPAEDTLENVVRYMATKRGERTTPYVCKTRRSLWVYLALNRESGYLRGIEEHFPGSVLEASREDYEPTPAGLEAWLAENLPYVFSGKDAAHRGERYKTIYEVDLDARTLGTPNAERASLERWIELAASDDPSSVERAVTLLRRYVHPDIAPETWGEAPRWYATWRDRLVFVESAGFWWMEDPRLAAVPR
ncbi:hypothetical protein OAV47_00670 [bacterium]|nr:hypothetical protein [bacterium]